MKREKISGGIHTVQQLLADGHVLRLYVADNKKSKNLTALVGEAQARGVPVETVALYEIEMMLPGVRHQGVAAVSEARGQAADWADAIAGVEKPLLLVLDSIQDPHNLGACLRSAAAAGVHAVLIPNSRAADVTPVVEKVACGATEILPLFRVSNLRREVERMQRQGIWVVGGAGGAAGGGEARAGRGRRGATWQARSGCGQRRRCVRPRADTSGGAGERVRVLDCGNFGGSHIYIGRGS